LFWYDTDVSLEYSQKYTIVCFFEEKPKVSFPALEWPLHVTILDTFKTEWPLDTLTRALEEVALTIAPFHTLPTQIALLGEDKNVSVKLLQLNSDMLALHNKLLSLVNDGAFIFNTPEFVDKGFLPHATDQKDGIVQLGQKYLLKSVSLVDMFPNGDHMGRTILSTFDFGLR
jgi:hypothetical protein